MSGVFGPGAYHESFLLGVWAQRFLYFHKISMWGFGMGFPLMYYSHVLYTISTHAPNSFPLLLEQISKQDLMHLPCGHIRDQTLFCRVHQKLVFGHSCNVKYRVTRILREA